MEYLKENIGENIKQYIANKGIRQDWVIDRLRIDKEVFYNILNGHGDVYLYEEKIRNLFRIKDPRYFKRDSELSKKLNESSHKRMIVGQDILTSNRGKEFMEVKWFFKRYREVIKKVY